MTTVENIDDETTIATNSSFDDIQVHLKLHNCIIGTVVLERTFALSDVAAFLGRKKCLHELYIPTAELSRKPIAAIWHEDDIILCQRFATLYLNGKKQKHTVFRLHNEDKLSIKKNSWWLQVVVPFLAKDYSSVASDQCELGPIPAQSEIDSNVAVAEWLSNNPDVEVVSSAFNDMTDECLENLLELTLKQTDFLTDFSPGFLEMPFASEEEIVVERPHQADFTGEIVDATESGRDLSCEAGILFDETENASGNKSSLNHQIRGTVTSQNMTGFGNKIVDATESGRDLSCEAGILFDETENESGNKSSLNHQIRGTVTSQNMTGFGNKIVDATESGRDLSFEAGIQIDKTVNETANGSVLNRGRETRSSSDATLAHNEGQSSNTMELRSRKKKFINSTEVVQPKQPKNDSFKKQIGCLFTKYQSDKITEWFLKDTKSNGRIKRICTKISKDFLITVTHSQLKVWVKNHKILANIAFETQRNLTPEEETTLRQLKIEHSRKSNAKICTLFRNNHPECHIEQHLIVNFISQLGYSAGTTARAASREKQAETKCAVPARQSLGSELSELQQTHLKNLHKECRSEERTRNAVQWYGDRKFQHILSTNEIGNRQLFCTSTTDPFSRTGVYVFGALTFVHKDTEPIESGKVLLFFTEEKNVYTYIDSQLIKLLTGGGCPSWRRSFVTLGLHIDWSKIKFICICECFKSAMRLKLTTGTLLGDASMNNRKLLFYPFGAGQHVYYEILRQHNLHIDEHSEKLNQLDSASSKIEGRTNGEVKVAATSNTTSEC